MSVKLAVLAALSLAVPAVFAADPAKPAPAKAVPVQNNLIKNGSFQKGLSGWSNWAGSKGAKLELLKDTPVAGKSALRLTTITKKGQAPVVHGATVKGNTKYAFSCLVKGKGDSIDVKAYFWSKGKNVSGQTFFTSKSVDKWTPVKGSFTTPKDVNGISFGVAVVNGSVEASDFVLSETK